MTDAPLSDLRDQDLVFRVANGDVRAFEAIYDRHSAQAFGLAMEVTGRRSAAEEATQGAFLGIWSAAWSYDTSQGTLKTWLLSMVRNRSIDCLRREARHDRAPEIDDELVAPLKAAQPAEEHVADREESRHAHELLVSLPNDQRQVIELAYFTGLTEPEIAVKLIWRSVCQGGRSKFAVSWCRGHGCGWCLRRAGRRAR